eukprot:scaffold1370_cov98-Isochrysis_galbana.AAC.3
MCLQASDQPRECARRFLGWRHHLRADGASGRGQDAHHRAEAAGAWSAVARGGGSGGSWRGRRAGVPAGGSAPGAGGACGAQARGGAAFRFRVHGAAAWVAPDRGDRGGALAVARAAAAAAAQVARLDDLVPRVRQGAALGHVTGREGGGRGAQASVGQSAAWR